MKTFIISCMLIAVTALSAQTEKGRFIISGQTSLDLSYVSNTSSNINSNKGSSTQETFSLSIAPAAGYFVADNFAVVLQG